VAKPINNSNLTAIIRDLACEMLESAAVMRERYQELRQCTTITKSGNRCRSFALWDEPGQVCSSHFYKTRKPELTQEERKRQAKNRTRPKCECTAYPFPHRPKTGHCRWPLDPVESHPWPAGTRPPGKLRRRKINQILRRYGLRN
jgi:hypothetical protein